jgi:hypothetical protein
MYNLKRVGFFRKTWHFTSSEVLTPGDFEALAKDLSVEPLLTQKVGFVAARRAKNEEEIDTLSDGYETTNKANAGDWIVTNMTPHGKPVRDPKGRLNTYVIRADESAGKTSELGELFSAKGMVMTIELPGSFDIMAPWKERQKAKAGCLVRNGNEIYGIERFTLGRVSAPRIRPRCGARSL